MTPQQLLAKPLRTCRTMHACRLCAKAIYLGEEYRDGGHGRRAHETCVKAAMTDDPGTVHHVWIGDKLHPASPEVVAEVARLRIRAECAESYMRDATTSGGAVVQRISELERERDELRAELAAIEHLIDTRYERSDKPLSLRVEALLNAHQDRARDAEEWRQKYQLEAGDGEGARGQLARERALWDEERKSAPAEARRLRKRTITDCIVEINLALEADEDIAPQDVLAAFRQRISSAALGETKGGE